MEEFHPKLLDILYFQPTTQNNFNFFEACFFIELEE